MKKRMAAVLAAVLLLICVSPLAPAHAAADVCFVSLNDRLLDLTSQAQNSNGVWYVPYNVFSEFGVNYSYFSNSSTAMLFTANHQLLFDMAKNLTYDSNGSYYTSTGLLLNGMAYVPLGFVCSQFGLTWTYIQGSGHGSVCRIRDGSAILSDSQFITAAASLMEAKYSAYVAAMNPVAPTGSSKPQEGARTVYLSFQGMPSAELLDALKAAGTAAAFFLTADEIKASPDTVRRMAAERHHIGILCADYEEYEKTLTLLYECAHTMTVLTAAPSGSDNACRSMASEHGLVYCQYALDGVRGGRGLERISYVTSGIKTGDNYARILCGSAAEKNITSLLSWFSANGCQVMPVNEIDRG